MLAKLGEIRGECWQESQPQRQGESAKPGFRKPWSGLWALERDHVVSGVDTSFASLEDGH